MDMVEFENKVLKESSEQQTKRDKLFRFYSSHSKLGLWVKRALLSADVCALFLGIVSLCFGFWLYVRFAYYGAIIRVWDCPLGAFTLANVFAGLYYGVSILRYYLFLHGCSHMLLSLLFTLGGVLSLICTKQLPLPEYMCCGVSDPPWDYTLWHRSKWYMWDGSKSSNVAGLKTVVPMSCCALDTRNGQYTDMLACAGAKGSKAMRDAINMKPCSEPLMHDLLHWVNVAAGFSFGCAAFGLLPAGLAVLYSDMIQK